MGWPAEFDPPSEEGLVLVPSPEALLQDLGPFRTGRKLETDILPRSALVCASENGAPRCGENGLVRFAFEGNATGAVNLTRYHERLLTAASRLAVRAPSVAYGSAAAEHLAPVASIDLVSYVVREVFDPSALEAWSGECIADWLPPAAIRTPSEDPEITAPLCKLPMRSLSQGEQGSFVWLLMDGTILTKDVSGAGPLVAWRRGDPGLDRVLGMSGLEISRRVLLA